jgi:CDP-glycerol glycerophosphotransferase (TagB/SpsB family)
LKEHKDNKFLLLTTSLLVDRVFLYSNMLDQLKRYGDVQIWASSARNDKNHTVWQNSGAEVSGFPDVLPFKEFPYNFLRRLNEFVWDYRFPLSSRVSMARHIRNHRQEKLIKSLKLPARVIAGLRGEKLLESSVEKLLLSYPRSESAETRLKELKPSVLFSTGPFQFEQPAIFSAAKRLGIPTVAYIPSWDNVTTKNRMLFQYDGYVVWSEQTKTELAEVYPATKEKPVYVVGAPQYDVFRREEFYRTREEFCRQFGLVPNLPVIVYALGSPNFLKEHHGAIELAKRIDRGEMGDVQMLVRPHPIHDNAELVEIFAQYAPRVRVQKNPNAGRALNERSQDIEQVIEWVNTFRHADVVVNMSSTVTIDAALFDRPIVNLDFDPQPSRTQQELITEINHEWRHFQPVAESGGVWLVKDFDELANAVKTYIEEPTRHSAERRWITKYVCEHIDGRCGERMADALNEFVTKDLSYANVSARAQRDFAVVKQF